MHMNKSIILLIFLALATTAFSQEEKKDIFCGGMFLHTGYLTNTRTTENIDGLCEGLGGQLSFFVGDNLRIGTEGYASTAKYKGDGFYKLGWGGLMFGYEFNKWKLIPVISCTIGGGSVKDLYIINANTTDNNPDNVIFRKYSVMLISPSLSFEYPLTSIIHIVTKFDYVLSLSSNNKTDYANGPRAYVGVLFNK